MRRILATCLVMAAVGCSVGSLEVRDGEAMLRSNPGKYDVTAGAGIADQHVFVQIDTPVLLNKNAVLRLSAGARLRTAHDNARTDGYAEVAMLATGADESAAYVALWARALDTAMHYGYAVGVRF